MTTLQDSAGFILLNGFQQAKGTIQMQPAGSTGDDVIITYSSNGGLAYGLTHYSDFRLLPGNTSFGSRAALLTWADDHFYQVGDGAPGAGTFGHVSETVTQGGTYAPGPTFTHADLTGKTVALITVNNTVLKATDYSKTATDTVTRTDDDFYNGDEITILYY